MILKITFAVSNLSNCHTSENIACVSNNVFTRELETICGL